MAVFDIGKYSKINLLGKKAFQKKRQILESNLDNSEALVSSSNEFTQILEPSTDKGDVVMVVPTAIDPAKEIKFGLLFIVVASIVFALFTLFAYFGVRHYRKMLTSKKQELFDLEEGIVPNKEVKEDCTCVAKLNSEFNLLGNNPLGFLAQKNRNKLNNPWLSNPGSNNVYKKEEEFLEKPVKSLLANTSSFPHYKITSANLKPSYLQQKQNLMFHLDSITNIKKNDSWNKDYALETLKNGANSLSAFMNCETQSVIPITKKEKRKQKYKQRNRIRYTKHELVNLEPVQTYQLLEYCYDDGDLLVTDLVFPEITLHNSECFETRLDDLTDMRRILIDKETPSSIKTLELFRFVSISAGIKTYNNPIIFTLPYGLLIDTIINFNLVSNISNIVPLILKSAFVETVIMYCISCWKFEKIKNETIETFFTKSNEELYIPPKLKVYEFIITLMSQGFRNNLLEEVLIFFSLAPSPHMLPNVINQSKIRRTPKLNRLFKYLLKQLQQEHYICCANTAKWKHWELTTSGIECPLERESSYSNDNGEIISFHPLKENNLKELQENVQSYQYSKLNCELRSISIASDEDENRSKTEQTVKPNFKIPLFANIPNIIFGATSILPGSLSPSHTQTSPRHESIHTNLY